MWGQSRVTNCKGPHTIRAANVESTRNLISQKHVFLGAIEFKVRNERVILQFMCVGSLAGVTYLSYTVLMSSNKSETAVHCCDPALSVLVMLVSQNVFHVVSALQSIVVSRELCVVRQDTLLSQCLTTTQV